MRAAALLSAAVIAVGSYLAIASAFGFSASWIALGMFAIALVGAVAIMVTQRPSARATS